MNGDQFEAMMRQGEVFHQTRVMDNVYIVIRVDGRSFTKLTSHNFRRPFDNRFHNCMKATAKALLTQMGGIYVHTHSDEISLLLPASYQDFNRKVEKLISVSASIAGAAFLSKLIQTSSARLVESVISEDVPEGSYPPHFDSRVWLGAHLDRVIDYFRWRQSDAQRGCLNSWSHYCLMYFKKMNPRRAFRETEGKGRDFKIKQLAEMGIFYDDLCSWQRNGSAYYYHTYTKESYDPIKQETVLADRQEVLYNDNLPTGDEYSAFLKGIFEESSREMPVNPLNNLTEQQRRMTERHIQLARANGEDID